MRIVTDHPARPVSSGLGAGSSEELPVRFLGLGLSGFFDAVVTSALPEVHARDDRKIEPLFISHYLQNRFIVDREPVDRDATTRPSKEEGAQPAKNAHCGVDT
jgi:hypothetical protein